MCHRWTIIWLVPTLLRDHSIPLYIMDIFETINHARTARDATPTPSDDFAVIEIPIENPIIVIIQKKMSKYAVPSSNRSIGGVRVF